MAVHSKEQHPDISKNKKMATNLNITLPLKLNQICESLIGRAAAAGFVYFYWNFLNCRKNQIFEEKKVGGLFFQLKKKFLRSYANFHTREECLIFKFIEKKNSVWMNNLFWVNLQHLQLFLLFKVETEKKLVYFLFF